MHPYIFDILHEDKIHELQKKYDHLQLVKIARARTKRRASRIGRVLSVLIVNFR